MHGDIRQFANCLLYILVSQSCNVAEPRQFTALLDTRETRVSGLKLHPVKAHRGCIGAHILHPKIAYPAEVDVVGRRPISEAHCSHLLCCTHSVAQPLVGSLLMHHQISIVNHV
jgi:hypothetical protein